MFECNCNDNRRDKLALRTTSIKNVKFKIIKTRTSCQYVWYFYYSVYLNWTAQNPQPGPRVGHNCSRESVKISFDSDDGNWFDECTKGYLNNWNFEKMQIFIFRKRFLAIFRKNLKLFLSFPFPVNFSEMFFWLGINLKTPTNKKSHPKWAIALLGWNCWGENSDRMTSFSDDVFRFWEKDTRSNFFLWNKLGDNAQLQSSLMTFFRCWSEPHCLKTQIN